MDEAKSGFLSLLRKVLISLSMPALEKSWIDPQEILQQDILIGLDVQKRYSHLKSSIFFVFFTPFDI